MRLKAAAGTIAFLLVLVATLQWGIHRRDAWSTEVIDKGIGGDALNYYEMAVSLERDHEVSIGHKPVWARPPGFPIFLWLTTHPLEQDPRAPDEVRMARYIATLRRAQFSVDLVCGLSAVLIALALRAKGFALLAAIVWAVQPWTALIAMHPLSDPLAAAFSGLSFAALAAYLTHRRLHWLAIAAALASAALWVHSSAIALSVPLLLAPLLIEDNWRQRIKALSLASLVWMLVFAPWVVRNDVVFGHPYAFTRGVDGNGQPWDRSAEDAWMRT